MGNITEGLEKAGYQTDSRNQLEPLDEYGQNVEPEEELKHKHAPSSRVRRPPAASGAWDERLSLAVNQDPYMPEVFRKLRSRILHPLGERERPRTVLVISAAPGEGKSFIAANLGISLSRGINQYCLLVDCDLRRPKLSKMFGLEVSKGLVDYLRDGHDVEGLLAKSSLDKLLILPAGEVPQNPAELLGSAQMRSLVVELADRYDDRTIVFDSPPTMAASETLVLADQMDGIIVVVRESGARQAQIRKLLDLIDPDRLLGMVFNGHTTNIIERSLVGGYDYKGYY